jgi:hypothetical protein
LNSRSGHIEHQFDSIPTPLKSLCFLAAAPPTVAEEKQTEAPIAKTVAAKIGAAIEAAVEGAAAIKEAIVTPGATSVQVTATATVTATVGVPTEEVAAPAETTTEPG